jgi:hypothetical protein
MFVVADFPSVHDTSKILVCVSWTCLKTGTKLMQKGAKKSDTKTVGLKTVSL